LPFLRKVSRPKSRLGLCRSARTSRSRSPQSARQDHAIDVGCEMIAWDDLAHHALGEWREHPGMIVSQQHACPAGDRANAGNGVRDASRGVGIRLRLASAADRMKPAPEPIDATKIQRACRGSRTWFEPDSFRPARCVPTCHHLDTFLAPRPDQAIGSK